MAGAAAFGVPAIDRHLGPIPAGGTVLLRTEPSVESLPFLLQCAAHQLDKAAPVVFVLTNRDPARLREALDEVAGHPIDARKLHVVDAYSALMGGGEKTSYPVSDPNNLLSLATQIDKAGHEQAGAVLLFDSLSTLLDRTDPERFLAVLPRIRAAAKKFRFTAALFTSWGYPPDVDDALAAFDATVALRGVEERVILHQTVAVERTPWGEPAKPTLFKVTHPGGILAYIPKIVVLGPHNAGKTTFVHAVSDTAMSVERMGTTVALDRGTVTLAGVKAEVFGTPGQERFDPLLPTLAGQAVGAILLVDATDPDGFPRAKDMLGKVWKRGLRAVIALNKSDQPGALGVKAATLRLSPPEGVEVMACVATDAASARAVLQKLIDQVLAGAAA